MCLVILTLLQNVSYSATQQDGDALDLYGFFHGHNYAQALQDFTDISGKTIMVLKSASGIWWSRWYDVNNKDVLDIAEAYDSNRIPLDTFVIDMDVSPALIMSIEVDRASPSTLHTFHMLQWHTKDAWGGWTFDSHLFPFPDDSMQALKQLGLPVSLNTHDAQGVNSWDAMFPAIVEYLGLPNSTTTIPLNLVNATVAYAVSDIVWCVCAGKTYWFSSEDRSAR